VCLKKLEDTHAAVPLVVSQPVVAYRETATLPPPPEDAAAAAATAGGASTAAAGHAARVLVKTANKHNRLWCRGRPIADAAPADADGGGAAAEFPAEACAAAMEAEPDRVGATAADAKARGRWLAESCGWDAGHTKRLWCFGPDNRGPNVVVDTTKGVQGLASIRDSVVTAFQVAAAEGPLCGEPLRGVRVDIEDATTHSDPAHRGPNQIAPAARRAVHGSVMAAGPRLLEPVFAVELQTVESARGAAYAVLTRRRGVLVGEEPCRAVGVADPVLVLRAHLPVAGSFGLTADLRAATGGQAFPQLVFDHWQLLPGDPLVAGTAAQKVVAATRARKGMKPDVPTWEALTDKL